MAGAAGLARVMATISSRATSSKAINKANNILHKMAMEGLPLNTATAAALLSTAGTVVTVLSQDTDNHRSISRATTGLRVKAISSSSHHISSTAVKEHHQVPTPRVVIRGGMNSLTSSRVIVSTSNSMDNNNKATPVGRVSRVSRVSKASRVIEEF